MTRYNGTSIISVEVAHDTVLFRILEKLGVGGVGNADAGGRIIDAGVRQAQGMPNFMNDGGIVIAAKRN